MQYKIIGSQRNLIEVTQSNDRGYSESIDAEAIQRKVVTQRPFEIMNTTNFTCLV